MTFVRTKKETCVKRKTAIEKEENLPNKAFYLSEAFFRTSDSELSMNTLAPELLKAKKAEELEEICKEIGIDYTTFAVDRAPLHMIATGSYRDPARHNELLSIYAAWLFAIVQTASACLDLYKVCLRVWRCESDQPAVFHIMDMLYFADKVDQQMHNEISYKRSAVNEVIERFGYLRFDYRNIPEFPLLTIYRKFQEALGGTFHKKYGMDLHLTSEKERYHCRYWDNQDAKKELKEQLWAFVDQFGTYSDKNHLLNFDDRALAKDILTLLDQHMQRRLSRGIHFGIDSINGETNVSSDRIDNALFLWIYTQIQNTKDYRICKICGNLFTVRSQKNRQFCYTHSEFASDYFYKKRRKQRRKAQEQAACANAEDAG